MERRRRRNRQGFLWPGCRELEINNIKMICEEFSGRVVIDIAIKNSDNKVGRWERNIRVGEIDKILNTEYNKGELIKYIKGA